MPPLPDLPGVAAPPADWSRADPIDIDDRLDSRCRAAVLGDWLRLTCPRFSDAVAARGHRLTQTRIENVDGGIQITTPYVRGTDVDLGLRRDGRRFGATIRWLGPTRPRRAAKITSEEGKGVPAGADF